MANGRIHRRIRRHFAAHGTGAHQIDPDIRIRVFARGGDRQRVERAFVAL